MFSNCPDPVAAYYSQDRYFGSVSENTENIIENYIKLRYFSNFFSRKILLEVNNNFFLFYVLQ